MKIIISPAKKMKVDTDSLTYHGLPVFLSKTEEILATLQKMSYEELKNLWNCSDHIAAINTERIVKMDLHTRLTPALLSFEGIQYQYMAPGVFSEQEFEYVQTHLRILSGFYGILKPFDGVTPYRLEMQTKLKMSETQDLYAYWNRLLADHIFSETDCVINLASKEYSACISRYVPEHARFITCVFSERKKDKLVEKGTLCKMARGEMVRFMAEHQIADPEQLKSFKRLGYKFDSESSNDKKFLFIKNATES